MEQSKIVTKAAHTCKHLTVTNSVSTYSWI